MKTKSAGVAEAAKQLVCLLRENRWKGQFPKNYEWRYFKLDNSNLYYDLSALSELFHPSALPLLASYLRDADPEVRWGVYQLFAVIGTPAVVEYLKRGLNDPDERIQFTCIDGIVDADPQHAEILLPSMERHPKTVHDMNWNCRIDWGFRRSVVLNSCEMPTQQKSSALLKKELEQEIPNCWGDYDDDLKSVFARWQNWIAKHDIHLQL